MKCEECENLFIAWTKQTSDEGQKLDQKNLDTHFQECPSCKEEFSTMQQLWTSMAGLKAPEPSENLKIKFSAMLATYKYSVAENNINAENNSLNAEKNRINAGKYNVSGDKIDKKNSFLNTLKDQLGKVWQSQPSFPLAYFLLLLMISTGIGFLFINSGKRLSQEQQLDSLSLQVHELKQTMVLAMLENPSASERIKAVSYTSEISSSDKQVIDALLATLNNDVNVNVRLSTLEALTHLADHAEVRAGLIHSILQQDSPLMQSAIADVMLKLQEKRSVKSFQKMLKEKGLDQGLRDKIRQTINHLI